MRRGTKRFVAAAASALVILAATMTARRRLEMDAARVIASAPYGIRAPVVARRQEPSPILSLPSDGSVRRIRKPPEEGEPDDEAVYVRLEDVNPKEFIRPFDKPFFTPEERKRLMEEPGVKFVRRGPKGSPLYSMGEYVWPFDDDQFIVRVGLEGPSTDEEDALAEEVRERLRFARPSNAGRIDSFPRWTSSVPKSGAPAHPSGKEQLPLVHSGWRLEIRRVRRAGDGWQARVHVKPVLRTEDYGQVAGIKDFHVEIYSWKDGILKLDQDFSDPFRRSDPADGIECVIYR